MTQPRASVDFLRAFEPSGDSPLSDQLYKHLRGAIRTGQLTSGQRLVEDAIANATSVSRMPVREALRRLANEGLAVQCGRGLVVATLNSDELQELWEVMESLWVTAVKLSAQNRSAADLAELTYLARAGTTRDDVDPILLNERFRRTILRAAGNRYLSDLLLRVVDQAESLLSLATARQRADLQTGHEAIVEAIANRDSIAAQTATEVHLRALLEAVLIQMIEADEAL